MLRDVTAVLLGFTGGPTAFGVVTRAAGLMWMLSLGRGLLHRNGYGPVVHPARATSIELEKRRRHA
jgi:hypothetical protein